MTLAEYMDPSRFPLTTQKGLSASDQLFIDAFNLDQSREYLARGGVMDEEGQARQVELEEKAPHMGRLTAEAAQQRKV
jgi:hypothetical protein